MRTDFCAQRHLVVGRKVSASNGHESTESTDASDWTVVTAKSRVPKNKNTKGSDPVSKNVNENVKESDSKNESVNGSKAKDSSVKRSKKE